MAASTVLRGRPIALKIGAIFICITKWNLNTSSDMQVVTNSCTPGDGEENQSGSPKDSGSFEGFMKSDKNIHAATPNIKRGQTVAATFYMDKDNAGLAYSGDIYLDDVNIVGDIKTQFMFTVNFTVQGVLTYPTFA